MAIYTKDEFKKLSSDESTLDLHKEILVDDIVNSANEKMQSMYIPPQFVKTTFPKWFYSSQ